MRYCHFSFTCVYEKFVAFSQARISINSELMFVCITSILSLSELLNVSCVLNKVMSPAYITN